MRTSYYRPCVREVDAWTSMIYSIMLGTGVVLIAATLGPLIFLVIEVVNASLTGIPEFYSGVR